jgi:hypothetical protein
MKVDDPIFNQMYAQQSVERDEKRRRALLIDMYKHLAEDMRHVPVSALSIAGHSMSQPFVRNDWGVSDHGQWHSDRDADTGMAGSVIERMAGSVIERMAGSVRGKFQLTVNTETGARRPGASVTMPGPTAFPCFLNGGTP